MEEFFDPEKNVKVSQECLITNHQLQIKELSFFKEMGNPFTEKNLPC